MIQLRWAGREGKGRVDVERFATRAEEATKHMRLYIGVTDDDWFHFLQTRQPDEVNFWRPSGSSNFKAVSPGEPFLFKLHSPNDYIVGGGFFTRYSVLPLSLAWLAFGEKNGAASESTCLARIRHYRKGGAIAPDPEIGCVILERPFFFPRTDWIPVASVWSKNIVQGSGKFSEEVKSALWREVEQRLQATPVPPDVGQLPEGPHGYWSPGFHRLGQGAFRVAVTDAYGRRCAVTQEHTLPVLEAAHIRPFSEGGPHDVRNGLLLRADLHILFDRGYVTVDEQNRFVVSRRLEVEWHNGRDYYARHGSPIILPHAPAERPSQEFLEWHRDNKFIA